MALPLTTAFKRTPFSGAVPEFGVAERVTKRVGGATDTVVVANLESPPLKTCTPGVYVPAVV